MSSGNPYHEVGFVRSSLNKIKIRGFDPEYLVYRMKWNLLGKIPLKTSVPIHVDLETASICNLKCTMCPHSKKEHKMEKGLIENELARKIIKDCVESGVTSLKLSGRGEPLLHPYLVNYVELAKSRGIIDVMFNTNGLLLAEKKTRRLVDAGLDLIIISIDGSTKETYESIRIGSSFDQVAHNIEYMLRYRKEQKKFKPMIRLQFVKMEENIREFEDFLRMWRGKADVLVGLDYSNRMGGKKQKAAKTREKLGRAYCPHPFRRLTISFNGKALMCCVDWDNKYVVGDCRRQVIKEIWHSKAIEYGRACIKKLEHDKIVSCRDCFAPVSFKWENSKHSI